MRALILSADLFEDSELGEPLRLLQTKGLRVDVAAPHKGVITGKHGGACALPGSRGGGGRQPHHLAAARRPARLYAGDLQGARPGRLLGHFQLENNSC